MAYERYTPIHQNQKSYVQKVLKPRYNLNLIQRFKK